MPPAPYNIYTYLSILIFTVLKFKTNLKLKLGHKLKLARGGKAEEVQVVQVHSIVPSCGTTRENCLIIKINLKLKLHETIMQSLGDERVRR